ncbi:hypothetical protein EVAR_75262_1 [Eumeta japonica]|uniref:Uncharacterized protein n=1 Tax=Eumeta variegata TaxID=151549 RepID=A0A4C1V8M8_EUMVA|nr:hypothetical protein EVAR_75262_1 [Eumeta japonica]
MRVRTPPRRAGVTYQCRVLESPACAGREKADIERGGGRGPGGRGPVCRVHALQRLAAPQGHRGRCALHRPARPSLHVTRAPPRARAARLARRPARRQSSAASARPPLL